MNFSTNPLFIAFFILYSGANYYIALRGLQALKLKKSSFYYRFYCLITFILFIAYPLGLLLDFLYPSNFSNYLTLLGSIWLAITYYLVLTTLFIDIILWLNSKIKFLPFNFHQYSRRLFVVIITSILLLVGYGADNAMTPVTQNYEITIDKNAGDIDTLQVVLVSDIHLGNIIDSHRLIKLVNRINQLEPDVVLIAGDIVDNKVAILSEQDIPAIFSRLHTKYGTYAVLGNHDYLDRNPDLAIKYLEAGNISVLRDNYTLVADSFYLVGRDDLARQRYLGTKRLDLKDIMQGINYNLPIILMDHQPHDFKEPSEQDVDLQLSGHTHLGQLFPNNLFTKKLYELDWGYLHKGNLQAIVSCGYGTWGPPVRIGNHPEIVNITIHFKK